MKYLFLQYPACDTCRKARKWLDESGISYESRHITENNPTYTELREWIARSGVSVKKFFNTSGLLYKSMGLKDKLPAMGEEEQIALLAAEGKLVKRPLLVGDTRVFVGFKPEEWKELV